LARIEAPLYKETLGQAIPFLVESFSMAWSDFLTGSTQLELVRNSISSSGSMKIVRLQVQMAAAQLQ
jgi:hypothetical protein